MAVDIDSVLEAIGEFGWYQKKIYFLLCLPVIFVGAANFSYTFIAASPDYRCYVPGCDKAMKDGPDFNSSFVNFAIPWNNNSQHIEMCTMYTKKKEIGPLTSCKESDFTSQTEDCIYGIVFDNSVYNSTIVTEFNLTCSNKWEYKADQSIYFVGMLFGAILFGLLSDGIGRRITILVGIALMSVSGIMIALVPNLISFHIMRFISAMASSGLFQTAFILGLEFVGPGKRVMFGIIGQYFFAMGEMMLGLLAYFIRDWRMLQLIISVPVSIFGFYYWIIPESLRWLQAKGHHAKVVSELEVIAKTNKKSIPLHLLRHEDVEEDETNADEDFRVLLTNRQKVTVWDIFTSFPMAIRTLSMVIIWVTTTLAFYGITFNAVSLADTSNPFIDFIIAAVAEIPGYTIAWMGMTMVGRRLSLMLSLLFSGLSCIAVAYLQSYKVYLLVSYFLGKCFITSAFAIIYIFTAELYPTSVRNTVIGICSMTARIGGMLAPFVATAGTWYPPLPMLIFGCCSSFSSLLTLVLPETLDTKLPDTLAQAINVGQNEDVVVRVNVTRADEILIDDTASLIDNRSGDDSDTQPIE